MHESAQQKPLFWIGRSYEDLLDCPDEVKRTFGFALGLAQTGGKYVDAKPLKGFGWGGWKLSRIIGAIRSDVPMR